MTVTMGFEVKHASEADSDITRNKNKFEDQFGSSPDYYIRVPGRVNIIGERKIFNIFFHFAYVALMTQFRRMCKNDRVWIPIMFLSKCICYRVVETDAGCALCNCTPTFWLLSLVKAKFRLKTCSCFLNCTPKFCWLRPPLCYVKQIALMYFFLEKIRRNFFKPKNVSITCYYWK